MKLPLTDEQIRRLVDLFRKPKPNNNDADPQVDAANLTDTTVTKRMVSCE